MTNDIQARAGEALTAVAAAIFANSAYADRDWRWIAMVYDFAHGGEGCFGYVFRPDGDWRGATPNDPDFAILDQVVVLRKIMTQATGAAWHRMLLHIDAEGRMDAQFEYDDPDRWTIRPRDLSASVETLRPRG